MKLQQNRYLWVYVAGLAAVPLLLDFCLAGLASAGPALPYGGQFWAIALLCITPSLAMQWLKPFYIFSLPPLAVRPTELTEEQRRCLRLFQSWQIKALAGATALFAFWMLKQLYLRASLISPVFTPVGGGFVALFAFFLACGLLQVSVSALRVLLVSSTALKRVPAYDVEAITSDFFLLGFKVKKILPEAIKAEPKHSESVTRKSRSENQHTTDKTSNDPQEDRTPKSSKNTGEREKDAVVISEQIEKEQEPIATEYRDQSKDESDGEITENPDLLSQSQTADLRPDAQISKGHENADSIDESFD